MKQPWHQPKLQLLDARATAQTDADMFLYDPNGGGDLGEGSETQSAFGNAMRRLTQADNA